MSEQQKHFDLARFVLDFLEQRGSIVTPPDFGVYEVLMPDELAETLGVDAYLRLSFDHQVEDALHLSVNHPLVDAIAEKLMVESANARAYVNPARLEKRGIATLAQQTFSVPNARVKPGKGGDFAAKFHYLQFNFKVTYDSDEKEEEIRSVVMDVQAGHTVHDEELLRRLESYEGSSTFASKLIAKPRWLDVETPYSQDVFNELLNRAQKAAMADIDERLQKMTARLQRFLELDVARIESYYDDLARDLQRRRQRAAVEDAERARNIDEKLAALEVERANKLTDVATRYRLNVDIELINVLLLEVPKIFAPIVISNRTVTITRHAVWNPLVHRLEPLVCDVCGKPGDKLYLCTGGHLAHQECLAPQCIDCKRVYCKLCSDQILECAVCHQPVCRASLIRCPVCGRGTCREHQGMCHADDGKPIDLAKLTFELQPPPEATPEPPQQAESPPSSPKPPVRRPAAPRSSKAKGKKRKRSRPAGSMAKPRAVNIHVDVFEDQPLIIAYVMRSARKPLATRTIQLTPHGISVSCQCEKGKACPVDGYYHRPWPTQAIARQIELMLQDLRQEYGIPSRKVSYHYAVGDYITRDSQVLTLPPIWKDEVLLRAAQEGYDRLG